jgi:DNA-binding transcriptional MerR regulator/mannose-6-phosphate isomerase-like protein (cupin superfamily)
VAPRPSLDLKEPALDGRKSGSEGPPPEGIYIKEAAQMVGVSPNVLRMWERERLVSPRRSASGYRLFSLADIQRLRLVRDLFKRDGLNAAGVRRVLGDELPEADRQKTATQFSKQRIGERIRRLRQERGASLRDLAQKTGLSPSYISSIERSLSNPSVASLQKLASALGTNLVKMLGSAEEGRDQHLVVEAGERQTLDLSVPGVVIEQLALTETQLEPLLFRIEPGVGSEESYLHEGEEFLYVLSGTFEITLEETDTYVLEAGAAMTFASHRPHRWRNPGATEACVIWVNTPPTF